MIAGTESQPLRRILGQSTFVIILIAVGFTLLAGPLALPVSAQDGPPSQMRNPNQDLTNSPGSTRSNAGAVRPADSIEQDTIDLKPGDQVSIILPGENWGGSVRIPPSGRIDFEYIGVHKATGKTLPELEQELEKKLSQYFKSPELVTNITSLVPREVDQGLQKPTTLHVAGAIDQPGRVTVEGSITFPELLAQRGGFAEIAKRSNVRVVREDNRVIQVDGEKQQDPKRWDGVSPVKLYPGDYVYVPQRGKSQDTQPRTYTMGAVNNPGSTLLDQPVPLGVAISETTNGLKGHAQLDRIKITRSNGDTLIVDGQKQLEFASVSPDEQVHVKPGDYIYVPGKKTEEQRVLVLGRVGEPQHVNVEEGEGVMDALVKSGSIERNSNRTGIYLFRKNEGDTLVRRLSYDRFVQGDFSQNVTVQNNDLIYVPTEFMPRFETLQSILQVMGFTSRAIGTAEDLEDLRNFAE